jgi:hypothetical protein
MATIITPKLAEDQRRRVLAVITSAILYDPDWSGADPELHEDADALCCSVDCRDEYAGAALLARIHAAVEGNDERS